MASRRLGPIVPCDWVVELDTICHQFVWQCSLEYVEGSFSIEIVSGFSCDLLELGYKGVQVISFHLEFPDVMLGLLLFHSIGVCLVESSFNSGPQVLFGMGYSSRDLIYKPLGLFFDPIVNEGSSDV